MTTTRPRIGLIRGWAAIETLDDEGNVIGYALRMGGACLWGRHVDFTPLAEVPEPRMDEPQETWATVVTKTIAQHSLAVFIRTHDRTWRRCTSDGRFGPIPYAWSNLIDPRSTTPTERATGIVGGEDR